MIKEVIQISRLPLSFLSYSNQFLWSETGPKLPAPEPCPFPAPYNPYDSSFRSTTNLLPELAPCFCLWSQMFPAPLSPFQPVFLVTNRMCILLLSLSANSLVENTIIPCFLQDLLEDSESTLKGSFIQRMSLPPPNSGFTLPLVGAPGPFDIYQEGLCHLESKQ